MDAVKAFNAELSGLYDVKPPISKAKMNSLTRGAIKAIKFYKHVVQSVEKFIQKCKPEYKVPGLYVIDSIVRQSRHQFGTEKDVFAPRFAKNMQTTFLNLLKCPPEDKSKVIRVLNLWQKNAVFPPEVIQPLFDLVDPNHPIHKEQSNGVLNTSAGNNLSNLSAVSKTSPSTAKNTPKDQKLFSTAKPIDPAWLAQTKMETANIVNANKLLGQVGTNQMDVSFLDQLQHLQQLLLKKKEAANEASQSSVKFDKKLLDFDYGEEEDDEIQVSTSPKMSQVVLSQHNTIAAAANNLESLGLLLANPEVLRQLQTLQQTMQNSTNTIQHEMEEKMRKLQQMKQQEEEFDKHLAQTVPTLPFAAECELKPTDIAKPAPPPPPPPPPPPVGYAPMMLNPAVIMQQDMSQPPPGYHPPAMPFVSQPPPLLRPTLIPPAVVPQQQQSPRVEESNASRRESSVEIVNCEPARSQSRSPDRYRRHSRSRSPRHRDRDRGRDRDRSDRKSRSRSRSRRQRSRSRERSDRKREDSRERYNDEEREKERERRKRGLPPLIREKLSVCSTTLWVGHLSKLVHQEELSDTFGEIGDIVSIDLISPRGCAFICMNRRQDAYKALTKLKSHKLQGKAITLAWAPGKGVKGKEWKDYWEVELGVSYIPWNKLNNITEQDLELFEEGGMIDDDSMPPWLKGKRKHSTESELKVPTPLSETAVMPPVTTNVVQPPATNNPPPMVDTSQPPPIRPPTQALLPPPNQLQMMPPGFTMPPGMLGPMGLSMPPGLMPNVPIGVPPPNMQGLMGPPGMMQTMMQPPVNSPFGALLTQIPMPAPAAPSDKPNATGMPHNVPPLGVPPPTSEPGMPNLPMMRQAFSVGPPIPMQQMPPQPPSQQPPPQQRQQPPPLPHQQHPDDMDVEMEDAMMIPPILTSDRKDNSGGGNNNNTSNKPQSLSDQLLAAIKGGNERMDNRVDNDRDNFRDRDRDRDRRDRDRGGGLGDRDRNDRDDRGRDRGRGRERGGRDRGRRNSRDNRDRDDRRNDRDRDNRDMRHSPMRQQSDIMGQDNDSMVKKDMGPKPSLADRLRQLADGTLPLIDERMDRDMRNRNDRSGDRHDRNSGNNSGPVFDEPPGRRPPMDSQPGPPSLLQGGRRPGDGPPSLLDLPTKFPGAPDRPDFGGPRDFGPRGDGMRDFPQRGPGLGDRDNRSFNQRGNRPHGRGPIDDFSEPPRSLLDRRFAPPDDFENRMGSRPEVDFDMRHGPPPPPSSSSGRDPEFPEGRPGSGRLDDFDRPPQRFDFDMRQRTPGDGPPPFDHPRGMPDDFEMRDHPDFDHRGRRDFFMEPKFGHPGMMGPRGPRGPMPPPMLGGPEGFGPRGPGPRHGPPMFHGRGMGPRGMRPNMRPPFGSRGPPFDPRDGPDTNFFRPGGFDEGRSGPPSMGRPNIPPFGISGPHPPPLLGDGPWRNEGPLPMVPPQPQGRIEPPPHDADDNNVHTRAGSTDRENRRRENRKSRWGNASPSAEQMEEAMDLQQSMNDEDINPLLDNAPPILNNALAPQENWDEPSDRADCQQESWNDPPQPPQEQIHDEPTEQQPFSQEQEFDQRKFEQEFSEQQHLQPEFEQQQQQSEFEQQPEQDFEQQSEFQQQLEFEPQPEFEPQTEFEAPPKCQQQTEFEAPPKFLQQLEFESHSKFQQQSEFHPEPQFEQPPQQEFQQQPEFQTTSQQLELEQPPNFSPQQENEPPQHFQQQEEFEQQPFKQQEFVQQEEFDIQPLVEPQKESHFEETMQFEPQPEAQPEQPESTPQESQPEEPPAES